MLLQSFSLHKQVWTGSLWPHEPVFVQSHLPGRRAARWHCCRSLSCFGTRRPSAARSELHFPASCGSGSSDWSASLFFADSPSNRDQKRFVWSKKLMDYEGKHGQSRQSLLENVPVGELFAEVPIHSTHTTCQCLFLWGGCLSVFHCHIYRRTLSPSSPLSSPEKSEITDQICVPLNKHMFCFWRQLCHCCTVPPSTDWRRRAADGGWEGGWVQESVWLFPPPLQQRPLDWRQISRRLLWSWKRRAFPRASGLQCVDFLKERDHL